MVKVKVKFTIIVCPNLFKLYLNCCLSYINVQLEVVEQYAQLGIDWIYMFVSSSNCNIPWKIPPDGGLLKDSTSTRRVFLV